MTRTRHAVAPLICGALALGLAAGQAPAAEKEAAEKKSLSSSAPPTPAVAVPPTRKRAEPHKSANERRETEAEALGHSRRAADRYERALKKWGGRAAKGDAGAQLRLGRAFRRGKDTEANAKHALHWLRAAAQSNLPAAHYQLGLFHMAGGKGRDPDLVEAYARFRIAANGGDVRAAALVFYIGVRMTAEELRRSHARIVEIHRFETVPAVAKPMATKPARLNSADAKSSATKPAAAEPAGAATAKTAAPSRYK